MQTNVDGLNVEYIDQGVGVPVLLMHGNPDSNHSWKPVIDGLGKGVRIIAPNFPGFGGSSPFPSDFDICPESMVEFWDALINFLDGL
jgi:haloalkane dehalogenase